MANTTGIWSDLALFTDFDGTIAKIVPDPEQARPNQMALRALTHISQEIGLVGVVSGRPLSFLQAALPPNLLEFVAVIGSYGLEVSLPPAKAAAEQSTQNYNSAETDQRLLTALEWIADKLPMGVSLETKPHSFTLHYRQRPTAEKDVRELERLTVVNFGLTSMDAKSAVEFFAGRRPTKSEAIKKYGDSFNNIIYLGDDYADIDVFQELKRRDGHGKHSLKIAVITEESPKELCDLADFTMPSTTSVAGWLNQLSLILKLASNSF